MNNDSWQELYAAAMLELDHGLLQSRIDDAQVAIRRSMEELMGTCGVGAAEEMQALSASLGNLQMLQRVEFRNQFLPAAKTSIERRGDAMKRACRRIATTTWRSRQLAVTELLHNAKVVTDPNKLAYLKAEVARRKLGSGSDSLHVKI